MIENLSEFLIWFTTALEKIIVWFKTTKWIIKCIRIGIVHILDTQSIY